jgi:hypothetical protein
MKFEDFVESCFAKECGLSCEHVLALRLYTTMVFRDINDPLRDTARKDRKEPHQLALIVYWLSDAIKLMRTVAANSENANRPQEKNLNSQPTRR